MVSNVIEIHRLLSNTVWLFFLGLGLWGLWRASRGQGIDGSYLGAIIIGELLFVVQGILGVILWANGLLGGLERPWIHVLYGVFAVVFMPFVYLVWLRGDDSNQAQWVMAFTILFLFGIALRAITTGI